MELEVQETEREREEALEAAKRSYLTGDRLISRERNRQYDEEGWTKEHDADYDYSELVGAAVAYLGKYLGNVVLEDQFPWPLEWFKNSDDPLKYLIKAGALIAAEIDRRLADKYIRKGLSRPNKALVANEQWNTN